MKTAITILTACHRQIITELAIVIAVLAVWPVWLCIFGE